LMPLAEDPAQFSAEHSLGADDGDVHLLTLE
jgi:hypothetical protein